MNIPNTITLSRIALIPVFVGLAEAQYFPPGWGLPLVFAALSISDLADGWLARSLDQVTAFGKILDPIADKILTLAGLLVVAGAEAPDFAPSMYIPMWTVLLIMTREFAISGLRSYLASQDVDIAASPMGKIKTTVQLCAIGMLLGRSADPFTGIEFYQIGYYTYWVALALTLISGFDYLWRNRAVLRHLD